MKELKLQKISLTFYNCDECKESFISKEAKEKHKNECHFNCNVVSKGCFTRKLLQKKMFGDPNRKIHTAAAYDAICNISDF